METITILGTDYLAFRPKAGRNECKFNRATKLLYAFEELSDKFDGMIKRGNGTSDVARMALAVKMMMYTGIRIGNESSAEGYMTKPHPNSKAKPKFVKTYGLTTLLPEHIIIAPRRTLLNFVGKKQVENSYQITGKLAKQVRVLHKTCEKTLFDVSAKQISYFIRKYVGEQFTPKDFRTMRANMHASVILSEILEREETTTKREANAELKEIAVHVSQHLSNTPGVCKASYIDPKAFEYFNSYRN